MQSDMYYDTVIVGCGVAGLYTALNLPKTMRVLMICKEDMAAVSYTHLFKRCNMAFGIHLPYFCQI